MEDISIEDSHVQVLLTQRLASVRASLSAILNEVRTINIDEYKTCEIGEIGHPHYSPVFWNREKNAWYSISLITTLSTE